MDRLALRKCNKRLVKEIFFYTIERLIKEICLYIYTIERLIKEICSKYGNKSSSLLFNNDERERDACVPVGSKKPI